MSGGQQLRRRVQVRSFLPRGGYLWPCQDMLTLSWNCLSLSSLDSELVATVSPRLAAILRIVTCSTLDSLVASGQPLRQPASTPAGVRGSRRNDTLFTLFGYPLQQESVSPRSPRISKSLRGWRKSHPRREIVQRSAHEPPPRCERRANPAEGLKCRWQTGGAVGRDSSSVHCSPRKTL